MVDKRYYPFSQYLKNRFGCRVHKVAIDGGFTCPNIDGTKSVGGCTYCNNEGFSFNSRVQPRPIREQIESGMEFMRRRFKAKKFLAYWQAYTNTYAPEHHLKQQYDQILPYDAIVALAVGTRPDSISTRTLDLLESYSDKREVWVEYGVQTVHNRTLQRINRCDTYERFLWAIEQSMKRNLKICVHVILGLPGESYEDMMETANRLAPLPFHSIKVHLLHIMKNTRMEREYLRGDFEMFSIDEYIQIVCDFIERIPPDVSVQRLTADAPSDILVAPKWCLQRNLIYQKIDKELERRDTYQGALVPSNIRSDTSWIKKAKKREPFPILQMVELAS